MSLYMRQKQSQRHRKQTCGCQGGGEVEEGWIGSLGLADTNYYIQDGQTTRPYCRAQRTQHFMIRHNGKEREKEYIDTYITKSLCCTAETNTTLCINYTSIKYILKISYKKLYWH